MKRFITLFLFFICASTVWSQLSVKDYERADSVSKFSDLVFNEILSVNWIDSTHVFWYNIRTPNGTRYFRVDAEKQEKTEAFDHIKLSVAIESVMNDKIPAKNFGSRI